MQANLNYRTLKIFTMPTFRFLRHSNKFLWRSSQIVHISFKELLRLSDELANGSFCLLDTSRVQLTSNRTVGKRSLASNSKTFLKSRLVLSRSLLLYFYGRFGSWFIWKELLWRTFFWCHVALRELLRHSDDLVNWSFCQSDMSRVQLKSKWTVGERMLASDQSLW